MYQEIFEKIAKIISDITGIECDKVFPQADFLRDLNIDPSEKAEILRRAFADFQVEPKDEEKEDIVTVQQLVELIHDKLS